MQIYVGWVPTTGLGREYPWYKRWLMRYVLRWAPFATSVKQGKYSIPISSPAYPLATELAGQYIINATMNDAIAPGSYMVKLVAGQAADDCYDEDLRGQWRKWLEEKGTWTSD